MGSNIPFLGVPQNSIGSECIRIFREIYENSRVRIKIQRGMKQGNIFYKNAIYFLHYMKYSAKSIGQTNE